MVSKIFFVVAVLGVARCEPPSNSYGTPLGVPLNSYGAPNYEVNREFGGSGDLGGHEDHGDHGDHGEPKAYEFGYQVKDDYTGTNYNRQEASDGNQVRGEYRVQLPDGRTQIVTYYADWQTGFHADVRYEGTAHYPDQYEAPGYSGGNAATSSVSIKDYNNGGYNGRPGYEYGAP